MAKIYQKETLKPEFKHKFVKNLQGKEFVLYNGLISLGKEKGIKSLTSRILQYPSAENNNTIIVESTLVGFEEINGEMQEVTYTGIGDANTGNCNKMVGQHFIRMADTRAKGRALRDYLGIDMVMSEELGGDAYQPAKITKAQTDNVTLLMKQKGLDKEAMKAFAIKTCGTGDFSQYTVEMGDKLIAALSAYSPANAEKTA